MFALTQPGHDKMTLCAWKLVTLLCLWMVTIVFLWMVTLVFLWMVTLVFLTPAVGWMVTRGILILMKFKICNLACSQSVAICLQISELFLFLHLEVSFPCGYFLTIWSSPSACGLRQYWDMPHGNGNTSHNMHARDLVYISKYCHYQCEFIDMQTMSLACNLSET